MTVELSVDRYLKHESVARGWRREFRTWCDTAPDVIELEERLVSAPEIPSDDLRTHRFLLYALLAKGEQLLLDLATLSLEETASLNREKLEVEAYLRRLEDALETFHRPAVGLDPKLAGLM